MDVHSSVLYSTVHGMGQREVLYSIHTGDHASTDYRVLYLVSGIYRSCTVLLNLLRADFHHRSHPRVVLWRPKTAGGWQSATANRREMPPTHSLIVHPCTCMMMQDGRAGGRYMFEMHWLVAVVVVRFAKYQWEGIPFLAYRIVHALPHLTDCGHLTVQTYSDSDRVGTVPARSSIFCFFFS